MNEVIGIALIAWGAVAFMMFILWLVQIKTKNAGFVDMGWTAGLIITSVIYALGFKGDVWRKGIVVLMVVVWGARLLGLLIERLMKDPTEDKRYQKIRADWKDNINLKFFFFFQFQALLDIVLSIPFILIMRNPAENMHGLEYLAIVIWLIGYVGERIADQQLLDFKTNPANKGKTCQEGLWRYSRHPNYFFEWMMWVAYAVFAIINPFGWLGLIAPILMYYFLMHVSGVPLAEAQSLKTRGEEYRRYQATTSMFIPWFKAKE